MLINIINFVNFFYSLRIIIIPNLFSTMSWNFKPKNKAQNLKPLIFIFSDTHTNTHTVYKLWFVNWKKKNKKKKMQRSCRRSVYRYLVSNRGFCTSTTTVSASNNDKIVASVLFERLPVIIPKIDPVVYAFQEFSLVISIYILLQTYFYFLISISVVIKLLAFWLGI